nr:RNA-directed DNA polymerase, eukaryota, reverse transcriptase zinc-binding domain protein [Tanacetum cinerariifolium]
MGVPFEKIELLVDCVELKPEKRVYEVVVKRVVEVDLMMFPTPLFAIVQPQLYYGNFFVMKHKWSRSNARNLILILKCFEEASRLNVNLSKSRLFGVEVDLEEVAADASSLNCSHDSLPFAYLGLPVGKNMNFCDAWGDVIDRGVNEDHRGINYGRVSWVAQRTVVLVSAVFAQKILLCLANGSGGF